MMDSGAHNINNEASQPSADPSSLIGKTLENRYEVVRLLGSGAMGSVYEVRHLRLNKRFAMKVIHAELAQVPEFIARFEREAHSTSKLNDPHCISVTDFGRASTGELYLVMEFIEGETLSDLLNKELPLATALDLTKQILLGLKHAHQAGVVHRDIKPENVMCIRQNDGTWQAKVVDFGIAKLPISSDAQEGGQKQLTRAGVVFGTPQYMAPEQVVGGQIDARVDLYSVGMIVWRSVTGRVLFDSENLMNLLSTKISKPAPLLGEVAPGKYAFELEDFLDRALKRNPDERFASAQEMIAALDKILALPGAGVLAANQNVPLFVPATLLQVQTKRFFLKLWRKRDQRRLKIIAGAALASLGLIITLTIFLVNGSSSDEPPTSQAKNMALDVKAKPAPTPEKSRKRSSELASIQMMIAEGTVAKCSSAEGELRKILTANPRNAEARYLLGAALICKKFYTDGLAQYSAAIHLDDSYRQEKRILDDAQKALQSRKSDDQALRLLIDEMGPPAMPLLLKTASYHKEPQIREKAAQHVRRLGAGSKIDQFSSLSLDLQQLPSCKERGEVVSKLRELKDPRALPVLRQAKSARSGFLGISQKNACILKQLNEAIEYLEGLSN